MTVAVDPAIQQQYDQNAAARRSAVAEVSGELKTRQAEVAERIKADEQQLAALGKRLAESTVDEPAPAPARRVEDNDISAKAEAYQEAVDEPPAPSPPPVARAPVTRVPDDEEEVPSFQWDEDRPTSAAPPPPPLPAAPPVKRERPASSQDADEDLSEHDWLE
jgi:hypothetical protein